MVYERNVDQMRRAPKLMYILSFWLFLESTECFTRNKKKTVFDLK